MRYFEYVEPKTLMEASQFLEQHEEAKILAGGVSLLVLLKNRLLNPSHLVNLKTVGGLNKIERDDQERIRIGALNRHRDIYYSPLIQKYCPILTEAASKIATPPIRNAGTIGGNIAHAEPSADFPPSLIALKATLKLISTKGERRIPIAEFFTDYFENVLNRGEILAEIEIPSLPQRTAGTYLKLDKTTNAIAILGVATIISLDDKGVCIDAGIGLGGVGPTPLKVGRVKEILSGEKIEEDHIDRVAREAQAVARPTTDIYASAEYRKEMVYILTRRSMKESLRKALQCERGEKRP